MAFTFNAPRRVTPEESSPFNNLLANALKSYQQQVHARYAPQREQAEIIGKGIGPLAQIAVSPLMTGMGPAQQQQMLEYISKIMGGMNQGGGMPSMGGGNTPNIGSGGVMDHLRQMFGGGQSQKPSVQPEIGSHGQQPSNQVSTGFGQRAVAPAYEASHAPGKIVLDENNQPTSVTATPETIADTQKQTITNKTLIPNIRKLAKLRSDLLEHQGQLVASKLLHKTGKVSSKYADKAAIAHALEAKVIDDLIKTGTPPAEAKQQVESHFWQSGPSYKKSLDSLAETQISKETIGKSSVEKGTSLEQSNHVPENATPKGSKVLMVDDEGHERWVDEKSVEKWKSKGAKIKNLGSA